MKMGLLFADMSFKVTSRFSRTPQKQNLLCAHEECAILIFRNLGKLKTTTFYNAIHQLSYLFVHPFFQLSPVHFLRPGPPTRPGRKYL